MTTENKVGKLCSKCRIRPARNQEKGNAGYCLPCYEKHKAWCNANATRRKEAFRQWRLDNKEHDAARKRAWYLANREHVIRKEVERQRRKKLQTKLGDTE
ncbi:MAG: hypothetical protein WCE81_06030 [Halobacteriota archaeon]